mgnify:CR=1 FL=1
MQNSQKLMPPLSGKCHCGKIEFELMCHLKDLKRCNCSHCRRKGFVMTTVKLDEFKLKCELRSEDLRFWPVPWHGAGGH